MINHEFLYQISHPVTGKIHGHLLGTTHLVSGNNDYSGSAKIFDVFHHYTKTLAVELNPEDRAFEILLSTISLIYKWSHESALLAKTFEDSKKGIDTWLIKRADTHKIPIIELETLETQIEVLDSFFKRFELTVPPSGGYKKDFILSCDEYLKGNKEFFRKKMSKLMSIYSEDLIFERNRQMIQKIDSLLRSNQSPLIAVGVLHLYKSEKCSDGLIHLLRKIGWLVVPVLNKSDLKLLNRSNPKSLEQIIVQKWSSPEVLKNALDDNFLVTARSIILASNSPSLNSCLTLLIDRIWIVDTKDYSLTTIISGLKPCYEKLLKPLVEKYPEIDSKCIWRAIKYNYSEDFIKDLLKKCPNFKLRKKELLRIAEKSFSNHLKERLFNGLLI